MGLPEEFEKVCQDVGESFLPESIRRLKRGRGLIKSLDGEGEKRLGRPERKSL